MRKLWQYILRLIGYDIEGNQTLGDDEDERYIMGYVRADEKLDR